MNPKNPNEKKFYVYLWWNDDKEEIFYVGKGCGRRYKVTYNRNPWFTHIVNKYKCHPEIIIDGMTSDEALEMERRVELILRKNEVPLVNLTECGGQPPLTPYGKDNPNYGHRWTEEMKQRIGQREKELGCHAGNKNGRARKVKVEETGEVFSSLKDLAEQFFKTDPNRVRSSVQQYGKYRGFHIIKL